MRHWNLIVLFYLLFTLNQTPEAQKSTTLKQLETTWLNESQYFRARLEPEWPEKFLRKQNYSMLLMNPQRRQQTMKRYGPEWPEKIMKYNETKQSQNHKPQSPQTLQPFGLEVRKRATTKIALMDSKNQDVYPSQKANLHSDDTADENKTKVRSPITEVPQKFRALPDNRGSLYLRSDKKEMLFEPPPSQKKKPPLEPQGFFDDKPTTQDIIKASIASSDPEIQEGLTDMMDMFTMNLEKFSDNDRNLNVDDGIARSQSNSGTTNRNIRRAFFQKYTPPRIFTRQYNDTVNVKERTFRYLICDRRYLRNVCQFAIIYAFSTICERYNCSHNVIPRVWDVTKRKCENIMKRHNPNPVYHATFRYYRNNRLSPVHRWPLWNNAPQKEFSSSSSEDDYWAGLRKGHRTKNAPKDIPVGRKRQFGKKISGLKKKGGKKSGNKKEKNKPAGKAKTPGKGAKRVLRKKVKARKRAF